jgi:hypothetical protein
MVGLRGGGGDNVASPAPAPAPAPAPLPAASTQPAPPRVEAIAKVSVQLEANVTSARVTFRRRVSPTPTTMQITPSDIVEIVEVSAPGYKTVRYWLTFDRPTHLNARLSKGEGLVEASEEQTLVALGEVSASPQPMIAAAEPTPTSKPAAAVAVAKPIDKPIEKPVTVAKAEPTRAPARKIGKSAEEAVPAAPPAAETHRRSRSPSPRPSPMGTPPKPRSSRSRRSNPSR